MKLVPETNNISNLQKIIPFFLLGVFLSPLFMLVIFHAEQIMIRQKMKVRLENENLQVVSLHKSDIKWYKTGRELIIGEDLFDVKFAEYENEIVHFTGLYDHEEKSLKSIIGQYSHNEKKTQSVLFKLISLLQHEFFARQDINNKTFYQSIHRYYDVPQSTLPIVTNSVLTPPPEFL